MSYEQNASICTLAQYTEAFIKERRFLKGVSPATEQWYRFSFKAFTPVLSEPLQSTTALKASVIARIEALMGENRGNKAVSINTYLRCLKAFLRWCHEEGILKEPVRLSWLKEEQKILATFTEDHIKRLLAYAPRKTGKVNRFGGSVEARLHTVVCLLLDTGLRISEALGLPKEAVDFDNLVIRVVGKGNKQRLVPFSQELRRILWRYFKGDTVGPKLAFVTKNNTKLSQRDFLRDFKKLGKKLEITGVRISAHTCRHTFAVFWLRRGGDLFRLSRVLGHESIETTTKYLKSLGIEDLQATHQQVSLLSPLSARR